MLGTLFVVATPIGNMEDITLRALEILKQVSVIACEDTRVTGKLLERYAIKKKTLVSIHHHSDAKKLNDVIRLLQQGSDVAYVSDAGTPGVNDPGGKLVEAAVEADIPITTLPGASALTAAISACGFPMERFTYVGFLPHKKGRRSLIAEIAERKEATIFLESTHRIAKALDELADVLDPHRRIYIGRELTKKFETHLRGTIADVRTQLKKGSAKGEFTVIVAPT